jgi:hypothetical protein
MHTQGTTNWRQCDYIHPTGRRCNGPAMRNTRFCYHHRRRQLKPAAAYIPPLTDPSKVQTALTEVLRGLLTNRLTDKGAGKILYGIQMAVVEERKKPIVDMRTTTSK